MFEGLILTVLATSRVNFGSYSHPSVGIVIAGGWSGGSDFYDVVERSLDGGATWEDLPPLPMKLSYPCLVVIDNRGTMAITGGENRKLSYIATCFWAHFL